MTTSCEHSISSPPQQAGILQLLKDTASFASILRLCGALTVVAAMSAFLLQGWDEGNDLSRFYMLLTQTISLAAGGFGLAYLLKENKGARVFFGLSLLSVTVNMATLAALIFSLTQWGSSLGVYPEFAQWQMADAGAMTLAIGCLIAVSAPAAFFGYMVLARRSAPQLAGLFLFANLLLLLPVRESLWVGIVAIAAILLPLAVLHKRLKTDSTLRTAEGWFAIASVFAPAAILIVRSLWLYPTDALLEALLAGLAFTALRFLAPQVDMHSFSRRIINWLSLGAALSGALSLGHMLEHFMPDALVLSLSGGLFSLLMLDIATRSKNTLDVTRLACLILAIVHLLPLAADSAFNPLLCMLAGGAILLIGRHYHARMILLLGGFTALCGFAAQAFSLVQLIHFSSWITLAILGVSTIITASLIERHGALLKLKWEQFGQKS